MARYIWQPAFRSQCLGAQPGQVVEVSDALAAYQIKAVPGVDGQPCLIPVEEAPVATEAPPPPSRRRGRSAPEG